jgi:hypothetical protein
VIGNFENTTKSAKKSGKIKEKTIPPPGKARNNKKKGKTKKKSDVQKKK